MTIRQICPEISLISRRIRTSRIRHILKKSETEEIVVNEAQID